MRVPFISKPTVDSILSTFSATVSQLEALIADQQAAVGANNRTMARLREDNVVLGQEINKACKAAAKIKEIIS